MISSCFLVMVSGMGEKRAEAEALAVQTSTLPCQLLAFVAVACRWRQAAERDSQRRHSRIHSSPSAVAVNP